MLGGGGVGYFMLVVLVGGDREENLSALLLRSRSALLLRSRSAFLLCSRSGYLNLKNICSLINIFAAKFFSPKKLLS